MYAHKIRPPLIRPIEMGQELPVRIRPPCPHEDGCDVWIGGQVYLEGVAEGDTFGGGLVGWGRGDVG